MEDDYQKLKELFVSDPKKAIEESQQIICSVTQFDSYKDFYSYHLKNAHMSTCQNEWTSNQLCIFCRECAELSESCICLQCFLNGNHKGHHYLINITSGNCDCGDFVHWKQSGFCKDHHGVSDNENPENYLDEKLRKTLTDVIFKAAFSSVKSFTNNDTKNASIIIQFISSFLKFGDGFRRLISISLTEKIDFNDLMQGIVEYSPEFNAILQQLCGGLVNDQLFIRNFSKITYDLVTNKLLNDISKIIVDGKDSVPYHPWNHFWFHAFGTHCFKYVIDKYNWDWVEFSIKVISKTKEILDYIDDGENYNYFPVLLLTISNRVQKAARIQPNEQTQKLFDEIFTKVLSCGTQKGIEKGIKYNINVVTSYIDPKEKYDLYPVYHFNVGFSGIFESFQNNPNVKYDALFEQMDKTIDISPIFMIGKNLVGTSCDNENDKFVSSFLNQKEIEEGTYPNTNYLSYHNGASFFILNPLFESLVTLLKIDSSSRTKIGRLISMPKYQNLRIKLSIIALKYVLSYLANKQSIAPNYNKGLLLLLNNVYDAPDSAYRAFSRFIPPLQLLIGIKGLDENTEFSFKEFIAFEMARELGIFDDFSSKEYEDENIDEKKKQMIFTFLFVSLLLVTERKLFNFDGLAFVEEQIIFSLKNGIHSIDQLNKNIDTSTLDSWNDSFAFNDILMKVAESSSKKNESNENNSEESSESSKPYDKETLFYLKDGIKYNTISGINNINDQMTIMNNEISKHSNKLIQIPDFEPEETYFFKNEQNDNDNDGLKVQLKQFLLTPTVLAIVYETLRGDSQLESQSTDLSCHLAMNILILVSKFIKEENSQTTSSFNDTTEIHYENLVDFIKKLKEVVFKYHVDDKDNAKIENTLNPNSFISLLKMKISSNDLPPKSFIDLLQERGKLGNKVLNKISTYINLNFLNLIDDKGSSEEDLKAQRRNKAKKLKENIMNQYKDMISNYKANDSIDAITQASTSEVIDKEVCSICSTYKKDEVFAYPLFLYRTKLPFIFDKPPLVNKEDEGKAVDDIVDDFEPFDDKDDKEEEEEEKSFEVDQAEIFQYMYSNFPDLFDFDDLDEEQRENRNRLIAQIYKSFEAQFKKRHDINSAEKKFKRQVKQNYKEERENFKESLKNRTNKRCTIGANFVVQFNLCQHSVHPNCVKQNPFICPIDRSIKNCLLPFLDSIPKGIIFKEIKEDEESLTKSIVDSITSFVDKFDSFYKCLKDYSSDNVFIELIKSISSLISTYEVRLRSLPDCLDSEKTTLLARNLFLTTWYAYRIRRKPKIVENEKRLTEFQRFIKILIESDEIEDANKEEVYKKIVSDFIKEVKVVPEKLFCLLLRRICLSEHFLLKIDVSSDSISDIIEWDDILSPLNLSLRYGAKFTEIDPKKGEEFDFKPFSFLNFPKDFFHLSQPPFSLPIIKVTELFLLNMLDYNYMINKYDDVSDQIIDNESGEEENHKKNLFCIEDEKESIAFMETNFGLRHYPSLIFFIGKYASQIFLIIDSFVAILNTFYLDKYGCTDVDHKRSQPLFFNEERYEKFVDLILSGDFANSLHLFNK